MIHRIWIGTQLVLPTRVGMVRTDGGAFPKEPDKREEPFPTAHAKRDEAEARLFLNEHVGSFARYRELLSGLEITRPQPRRRHAALRLPRRRDEERPATPKPEPADVADVRTLDLSPRCFRTRFGGLFFFVPLLHPIDLAAVAREARLPGSKLIPAEHALRSLLALKLIGKERKRHVMDLVFDPGPAVFAGLNVIPKRSSLAACSSKIDHQTDLRLMAAWATQVQAAGLPRGDSFDLDFHTVPGYTGTLRQVTITELGHEEPTVLLTNQNQRSCPDLATRYAHRMLLENGISEAIPFFHLDALASMVRLKVDFDLQITLMASSLYRLLAAKAGREDERAQAKKLFRNLLDVSATVTIDDPRVQVTLDKRAHNPFLVTK